jgi:hypothetical protein
VRLSFLMFVNCMSHLAAADNLLTRARLCIITHKAKLASFQCFANLSRLSEAIASLQELQSLHDNTFGRQHKYYGQTLVALARAQHLSGNARAARCLYDKVRFGCTLPNSESTKLTHIRLCLCYLGLWALSITVSYLQMFPMHLLSLNCNRCI